MRQTVDVVVICPAYPGPDRRYGGQFVQSRAEAYSAAGLTVCVVEVRQEMTVATSSHIGAVQVLRGNADHLSLYLSRGLAKRAVIHHPEPHSWTALKTHSAALRPLVIIHGYEARPWTTLASSFTEDETSSLGPALDQRDIARRAVIAACLSHSETTCLFVSKFMQKTAEAFSDTQARSNAQIIHNPVLETDFPYRRKSAEQRLNILWLRSFQSKNYANDLARDALLILNDRKQLSKFRVTIRGDGKLWDEVTAPLKKFSNITLIRGFVPRSEVSKIHESHGIMLAPSRWESQGLTICEAMSSGLVPVTTSVAAVPEFVSDADGLLCLPESAASLADAIEWLGSNPDDFQLRSRNASKRMAIQCGKRNTVDREIELLK